MKVRATLIELWKKITPFKEQDKVFWNGDDNDYSEKMEAVIGNSPTGARAKEMFMKFVYGAGLDKGVDVKFANGVKLSEVAKDVIDDVVIQNGAFIHTTYKVDIKDGEPVFLLDIPKSLDYNKCRISKDDDDGNKGMILFKVFNKQDANATKEEKKFKTKYYPFNPDQNVVKAQIEADAKEAKYEGEDWAGKIRHYRGQVMYLNLTPKYRYAISKFDPVYDDLDTEARISTYCNMFSRGGFLGKTAVLTQGLDSEQVDVEMKKIENWLGVEGSIGIYHMDVEQAEKLEDVMKIIQVPTQFNADQFKDLRKDLRTNILGAANNLPSPLAFAESGAMFDSGEKYVELKKFYWEQCEWERQKIEEAFAKLGYTFNFLDFDEESVVATSDASTPETTPEANDENLKAQAALRGSVGGVQGILGIQESVSQGITDVKSAVTILVEIYGFSEDVSYALLGSVKEAEDGNIVN